MTNIRDLEIPKSIKKGNFHYSFKQRLENNNLSYNCNSRKSGFLIKIALANQRKIITILQWVNCNIRQYPKRLYM